MALFYVLQKISIPNYPAKVFWVNLTPFVNVNVDSYLLCGSRLKNEVYILTCTFPCVCPRCLFSLHTCLLRRKCKRSPSLNNKMQLSDGNYSLRRE